MIFEYIIFILVGLVFGGIYTLYSIFLFICTMHYLIEYFDPIQLNDEIREKCINYYCEERNCTRPVNSKPGNNSNPFRLHISSDCFGTRYISLRHDFNDFRTGININQFDLYYIDFKIFAYVNICKKNYCCYLFLMFVIKLIFIIVGILSGYIISVLVIIYYFFVTVLIILKYLWKFLKCLLNVCFIMPEPNTSERTMVRDIENNNNNNIVS